MKTSVVVLRGKNARRIGTMPGTWADREGMARRLMCEGYGRMQILVHFASEDYPREYVMIRLANLREATPLEKVMAGHVEF